MQKLGYILTQQGLLTDDQLKTALELHKMTGKKLGDVIAEKGMLSDIQIMKALEIQCKIPYIDLSGIRADPGALNLIGEEYAKNFCAIPLGFEDDSLIVAINDPLDVILVDEIGYLTGKKILPRLSTKKQILASIESNYSQAAIQRTAQKAANELEKKTHKSKVVVEQKPEPAPIEIIKIPEPAPVPIENIVLPVPEPVADIPVIEEIATELPMVTIPEEHRVPDQGGFMLDFTKSVKQHFSVNMIDNQVIRVRMPTKRVFAALFELQDKLSRLVTLNSNFSAQLDEIYRLCATILSNNLEQKEISSEYLSDLLDLEDLRIFYKAYMDFVNSVLNGV